MRNLEVTFDIEADNENEALERAMEEMNEDDHRMEFNNPENY